MLKKKNLDLNCSADRRVTEWNAVCWNGDVGNLLTVVHACGNGA